MSGDDDGLRSVVLYQFQPTAIRQSQVHKQQIRFLRGKSIARFQERGRYAHVVTF
jgi:hypothetical protein